jgi:hypothetical protein
MRIDTHPLRLVLATAVAIAASWSALPALAGTPQAVTISTTITFPEFDSLGFGTFTATGPICTSGTFSGVREALGVGPAAFNVNSLTEFVCDDNSGSFVIHLHPQANARPKGGFDLDGPWATWGKGTGDYASMSGHGEFGVVLDWSADPLTGQETYVGFVTF